MDEYTKLLERIRSYFIMEDVQEDSNVISVYTLSQILKKNFSELKIVEQFQNKLNGVGKLFRLNSDEYKIFIESFNEIRIYKNNTTVFNIFQDKDTKELYFEGGFEAKKIISKNYMELLSIFDVLENIKDITNGKFSNYQWLNKETLSDYIYDNAGIILKKISIEIDTLNPLFRNAVRLQIKSKQKTLS